MSEKAGRYFLCRLQAPYALILLHIYCKKQKRG